MKKVLLFLMLLFATNVVSAQTGNPPVILHPTSSSNEGNKDSFTREPLAPVYVYQDGHTLTFESSCIGCTITLLNENDVIVYIDVVDENGEVEIPTTFVGTYELQLVKDDITFVGEIEL